MGGFAALKDKNIKRYTKVKYLGTQGREWIPLLVLQAGKTAPRMYSTEWFGKQKDLPVLKRKSDLIEMEELPFEKRITPKYYTDYLWRKRKQIFQDLADILVENIKLGVSHGDLISKNEFLRRGQDPEEHILIYEKDGNIHARPYDYGLGKIIKAKRVELHKYDYRDMMRIIRNMFNSKAPGREFAQVKEEFDRIFEQQIEKKLKKSKRQTEKITARCP